MLIESNLKKLNEQVFDKFISILDKFQNKENIVIWLSWGSSILWFYEILKTKANIIDKSIWQKIQFVFVDERIVSLDHNDSNYKLNKDYLFDFLLENNYIKNSQIITIDLKAIDIVQNYFQKVPYIDIWLFGVGPDGHTCSLFPWHKLNDMEGISFLEIKDSPKPPSNRITLSKDYIATIPYIFIYFIWEGKKEAFQNFQNVDISKKNCPCKYALDSQNCIVVSDIKL